MMLKMNLDELINMNMNWQPQPGIPSNYASLQHPSQTFYHIGPDGKLMQSYLSEFSKPDTAPRSRQSARSQRRIHVLDQAYKPI